MRPRLFAPGTTDFSTRGIGTLADCLSAVVTEERNGIFELELTVPIESKHFSRIEMRSYILAKPNPYDRPQPFFVYDSTKPINGLVTFRCRHVSYDTDGIPVAPFLAVDAAGAVDKLNTKTLVPTPFTFTTDITTQATMQVKKPTVIRELMAGTRGSLVDVYGGEYAYDYFNVSLLKARGQDRGVRFAYGKNILDLRQEESIDAVYTGVLPYWYTETDGLVQGDIQRAPGTYPHTRILMLDLTEQFDRPPSVSELNTAGAAYVARNKIGVPRVSLKLEVLPPGSTGIAALEEVQLCDTVSVRFARLGVEAEAKVISTKFDALRERYLSIELGDRRTTLADTIAQQELAIEDRPTAEAVAVIAATLTAVIIGAKGGSVRLLDTDGDGEPDTLYIADNPDPDRAVKVWRFNYEGWGASLNGYNGPFVMGMTFTDGGTIFANVLRILNIDASNINTGTLNAAVVNVTNINATNITAGTLSAARIAANSIAVSKLTGTISGGLENSWELNLTAGTLTIGNISADNITAGTLNAENVIVTNINGQNVKGKTIGADQMADGAAVNRVIATDGVTNRCIASGSVYTSTCDSTIQGYFADVIETQKLYAGNARVDYLRCGILKADGFSFTNSGAPYKIVFNGLGAPLTAATY